MKTVIASLIAASSALLIALPASAQEFQPDFPSNFVSSTTRDAVRADAQLALAAGQIAAGEHVLVAPVAGDAVTRAQVQAELQEARRLDQVSYGEHSGADLDGQV